MDCAASACTDRQTGLDPVFFIFLGGGLGVLLRCIFAAVCCDVVSYPIYRVGGRLWVVG